MMRSQQRRAFVLALCCASAAGASVALKPSRRAAESYPPIDLDKQVPLSFADWRIDRSIVPLLPDPGTQAALDKIYNQVLARSYVDANGQRVMLSIAYGADQGTDATAAHRPEFCYSAQGFSVRTLGEHTVDVGGHPLVVRRLVGTLQGRREPISYWVTLNDAAVLPGVTRKMQQIRLGLQGQIPDGMLVRVSTISNVDSVAFGTQERFLADLRRTLAAPLQARYFGA